MTKRRDVPTLAYTITEAADAIRVDPATVRTWVKDGTVRSIRWTPTSPTLIAAVELDALINRAMTPAGAPALEVVRDDTAR